MTMQELKLWKENKKKAQAAEWNKVIAENGNCKRLTNDEYNKLTHKQKSGVTRRTHARGNHWNHFTSKPQRDIKLWWEK